MDTKQIELHPGEISVWTSGDQHSHRHAIMDVVYNSALETIYIPLSAFTKHIAYGAAILIDVHAYVVRNISLIDTPIFASRVNATIRGYKSLREVDAAIVVIDYLEAGLRDYNPASRHIVMQQLDKIVEAHPGVHVALLASNPCGICSDETFECRYREGSTEQRTKDLVVERW